MQFTALKYYRCLGVVLNFTLFLSFQVYVSLGIPDFGWVLLSRNETSSTPLDTARSSFQNGGAQPRRHCKDKLTASSLGHSSNVLQLLQSGGGPERKRLLLADVPSIGMNIAEQLHRLERKRDNRHFLPTDAFGWTVIGPSQQQNGLGVMVRRVPRVVYIFCSR